MAQPSADFIALIQSIQVLEAAITGLPMEITIAMHDSKMAEANLGYVPAFDRPQPVIMMGPRPLPVTIVGGMGGGNSNLGQVTAFDRPQAVVIMGPNPLPVSVIGGIEGGKPGPREPKEKGSGGLGSVLGMLGKVAGPLLAVAGPAALLSAVLADTSSGFKLLGTGVKLLASVFAPFLLPVTMLLTAGMVAAAAVISEDLEPTLEAWFDLVFSKGIPALEKFIEFLDIVGNSKEEQRKGLSEEETEILDVVDALDSVFGGASKWAGLGWSDAVVPFMRMSHEGDAVAAEQGKRGEQAREKVDTSLTDVLQSFKKSIGPQASISGLGDVGRQVQTAALNADPLELQIQKNLLATAERIERALNRNRTPRRVYDREMRETGAGNYDKGISGVSGGDYGYGE